MVRMQLRLKGDFAQVGVDCRRLRDVLRIMNARLIAGARDVSSFNFKEDAPL